MTGSPRYLSQLEETPFTPQIYDSAGVEMTYGTGATRAGGYSIAGRWVEGWSVVVLGTSPSVANAGIMTFVPPIAPAVTPTGRYPTAIGAYPCGSGYFNDASSEGGLGESSHYVTSLAMSLSAARILMVLDPHTGTWGYVADTDPVSFAAGDKIACFFRYPRSRA